MRTPVVLAAALALALAAPAAAQMAASDSRRTITVTGEAEVRVPPDEVIVSLGVETFDADMQRAKAANDARVTAVLAAVRGAGVPEERVKTDYLGLEPRYQDYNETRPVVGYVVRRSIVVTLREIPAFERMMQAVLAAGATHVHGTDFRTTALRAHRDRAREMAIDAAREKAQAMAARLGQRVGAPLSVSEGWNGWWGGQQWGARRGAMMQNAVQNAAAPPESSGPLSPGQIAVGGSVSVTFELLP